MLLSKLCIAAAGITALAWAAGTGVPAARADQPAHAAAKSTSLQLDPTALDEQGMRKYRLGYMPVAVKLSADKPAEITKEPAYTGKPLYGTIHLGNGPQSLYVLVLDPSPTGDYKIYLDKNRNGDLTDDGDGSWSKKNSSQGRVIYGINSYVLRASWGKADKETASGEYGIGLYCFAGDSPRMFMFREAARIGSITLAGKSHKAMLVENDADALFSKPVQTDAKGSPVGTVDTRPVWLLVDLKDDGTFRSGGNQPNIVDIRGPFTLAGANYEAKVASDGSSISLTQTKRAVADFTPKAPPLLAKGTPAPNFSAERPDGTTVQLSDLKGKVVILDFWATWCGPCQMSMPHLEKVYQAVKDKGVAVLGVCVWDERKAFDTWLPAHKDQYTFPLAFDPAGRADNNIALKLYQVSGIPTTYIIDKDGKVVEAIVGYDQGDTRIEAALKKIGIEI